MSELGAAASAAMAALVGESGIADDAPILIAQLDRAVQSLEVGNLPQGALFGLEPSSHAAALLVLAPERAR